MLALPVYNKITDSDLVLARGKFPELYFGIIYLCKCIVNNKNYIGQTTTTLRRRWAHHKFSAENLEKRNSKSKLHNAMRCFGHDNFDIEIIEIVSASSKEELINSLNIKETYYIALYDSVVSGYNIMSVGGASIHEKPAKERHRFKKGSIPWNKGKKLSDDIRATLSSSHKGRPWTQLQRDSFNNREHKGHTLSEEVKRRIGDKNRGRFLSEEARLKMSEAHRGNVPVNKGVPMSKEKYEKCSATMFKKGGPGTTTGKKLIKDPITGKGKFVFEDPIKQSEFEEKRRIIDSERRERNRIKALEAYYRKREKDGYYVPPEKRVKD